MNSEIVTKHPATIPFLRYQVRSQVRRAEMEPVFRDRAVTGFRPSGETVSVIYLVGFGETEKKARDMAQKNAAKYRQ